MKPLPIEDTSGWEITLTWIVMQNKQPIWRVSNFEKPRYLVGNVTHGCGFGRYNALKTYTVISERNLCET